MFPYKQISKLNLEKVISSNKRKHLFFKKRTYLQKGDKNHFWKDINFQKINKQEST